jgi:hypothetical protein
VGSFITSEKQGAEQPIFGEYVLRLMVIKHTVIFTSDIVNQILESLHHHK